MFTIEIVIYETIFIWLAIGVEKISYKQPPSLKKSIEITFIKNGPVVILSLLI